MVVVAKLRFAATSLAQEPHCEAPSQAISDTEGTSDGAASMSDATSRTDPPSMGFSMGDATSRTDRPSVGFPMSDASSRTGRSSVAFRSSAGFGSSMGSTSRDQTARTFAMRPCIFSSLACATRSSCVLVSTDTSKAFSRAARRSAKKACVSSPACCREFTWPNTKSKRSSIACFLTWSSPGSLGCLAACVWMRPSRRSRTFSTVSMRSARATRCFCSSLTSPANLL
mmetsp:Transcript_134068/g.373663  ORF Transcript_134068/g.373663 Transcript_134068/m.373663 type:complete len:227 (+) Transcript_134068:204-884(+)